MNFPESNYNITINDKNDPSIESAIKKIEETEIKEGECLSEVFSSHFDEGASTLSADFEILETNFTALVDATNTINAARVKNSLDFATYEQVTKISYRVFRAMCFHILIFKQQLPSFPTVLPLQEALCRLHTKIERAATSLFALQSFHTYKQQIDKGLTQMSAQQQHLNLDNLNYSTAPLNQALSAISFSALIKHADKANLQRLHAPILQSIEQFRTALPQHGQEYRSALYADLREASAQSALAAKNFQNTPSNSYKDLSIEQQYWNHLCAEHQSYIETLQSGIDGIAKITKSLKNENHSTSVKLLRVYTLLLKQLEQELQQAFSMETWIEEHGNAMLERMDRINQRITESSIAFKHELVQPIIDSSYKLNSRNLQNPQAVNSYSCLLQLRSLQSILPTNAFQVNSTIEEIGSLHQSDEEMLHLCVLMQHRKHLPPVTSSKKMRREASTFRSILDKLEAQGDKKLEKLGAQTDSLENLSHDYSVQAIESVFEYIDRLFNLSKSYQADKYSSSLKKKAAQEIAYELDTAIGYVEEFYDALHHALSAEILAGYDEGNKVSVKRWGAIRRHTHFLKDNFSDLSIKFQKDSNEIKKLGNLHNSYNTLLILNKDIINNIDILLKQPIGKKIVKQHLPVNSSKLFENWPASENRGRVAAKQKLLAAEEGANDAKKQAMGLALLGLIGVSWVSEGVNLGNQAQALRRSAALASNELQKRVPQSVKDDASFIGTMLKDKLKDLRSYNDAQFEKITKRHPETRPTLEPFRHSSGPLTVDIQSVMQNHIMQRAIVSEQRSLSIEEWLNDFFTDQHAPDLEPYPVSARWREDLQTEISKIESSGAPVELKNLSHEGLMAELGQAIALGSQELFLELVNHGVPLNIPFVGTEITPLQVALESQHSDPIIVNRLLEDTVSYPSTKSSLKGLIALVEKTGDHQHLSNAVSRGLDITKQLSGADESPVELMLILGGQTTYEWLVNYLEGADTTSHQWIVDTAAKLLNSDFLQQYSAAGFSFNEDMEETLSASLSNAKSLQSTSPLTGESRLFKAILSGDVEVATSLIERGANPKALSLAGETMLHAFAKGANTSKSLLEKILKTGVDINAKNSSLQDTALHIVLKAGNLRIAKMLIEAGASVVEVNQDKKSPLHLLYSCTKCLDSPAFENIQEAILKGIDEADGQIPATGETPWHIIYKTGFDHEKLHISVKDTLPKYINSVDKQGNTLIHAAAEYTSIDSRDLGKSLDRFYALIINSYDDLPLKSLIIEKTNAEGDNFLHVLAHNPDMWRMYMYFEIFLSETLLTTKNHRGQVPMDLRQSELNVSEIVNSLIDFFTPGTYRNLKRQLMIPSDLVELAYAWEIGGQTQVNHYPVTLSNYPYGELRDMLQRSIHSMQNSFPNLMTPHQVNLWNTILQDNFVADLPAYTIWNIKRGKTESLLVNLTSNLFKIVFHRGYLIVFDIANINNKAIQAYKVDVGMVREDLFTGLANENFKDGYDAELQRIIDQLDGYRDNISTILENFSPHKKYEPNTNTYEGVELALYGTLALDELIDSGADFSSKMFAIASSVEIFQALLGQVRLDALETYLTGFSDAPSTQLSIAHDVIKRLCNKELQELRSRDEEQLLVKEEGTDPILNPIQAKQLYSDLYHCRYVMGKTNVEVQKCLANGFSMPAWREKMEERLGELKGKYSRMYAMDPQQLSITNAAQSRGFNRPI